MGGHLACLAKILFFFERQAAKPTVRRSWVSFLPGLGQGREGAFPQQQVGSAQTARSQLRMELCTAAVLSVKVLHVECSPRLVLASQAVRASPPCRACCAPRASITPKIRSF